MRHSIIWAFGLLAFAAAPASAQLDEPIATTIEESRAILAAERAGLVGAQARPVAIDGGEFLLMNDPLHEPTVWLVEPATGRVETLIVGQDLAAALAKAGLDAAPSVQSLDASRNAVWLQVGGESYRWDIAARTLSPAPERDRALQLTQPQVLSDQFPTTFGRLSEVASPDGSRFVTLVENDLAIRTGDEVRRLTDDGAPRYGWRNAEEFSPGFNVKWSPDGKTIAAVKLDERDVPHEPLYRPLTRGPTILEWPYPRAGEPIARFELWLIDAETGVRTPIDTGETEDHYVSLVGWGDDGAIVWWQKVSRDQKRLRLFAADPATGESRLVYRQEVATYFDTPMTLGPPNITPLSASDDLLVMNECSGTRQLYLIDGNNGVELHRISDGAALVQGILKLDEARGEVWLSVSADPGHPYHRQIARARLDGSGMKVLTPETGTYSAWIADDGSGFMTRRSDLATPPVIEARDRGGSVTATVSRTDASGLSALGYAGMEELVIDQADGPHQIRGVILKPFGFDPAKRYPVVEVIYAGMQVSSAPTEYYASGGMGRAINGNTARVLAQQGFVVVFTDAPGTPGRGRAFQDATYGTWPQGVIADHAQWLREAASTRPWMDLDRVGIYGNSWGGYMAVRALIDEPELYKVAVAMAAPQDLDDHPFYIEPFMGLPQDNPDGYAAASNLDRVSEIEGRVLAMSWPLEVNAGFSPWWKLIDRMVAEGKDLDVFTMPGVNHRVSCCGTNRADYGFAKITRYFRHWLGDEE
ncbi:MAG: DPP IV N-terminal domain-containing protein [Erythrobacter sp.]|uniref:S9 family peptidase n=1 Tax=Erythrobacter sp. TaxID=1042 RepID=UPI002634A47D|nr:DPP IV N-terminal domain-containing protein [Erythrobacter sp.]MDJ0978169.1 DPP IV N-terminal domain-containing protein [Erythrobacter sp.]